MQSDLIPTNYIGTNMNIWPDNSLRLLITRQVSGMPKIVSNSAQAQFYIYPEQDILLLWQGFVYNFF